MKKAPQLKFKNRQMWHIISPGLVRKASKDERNFRKRSTKFFEVNFFLGTSVLGWFKLDFSPKQVVRSTHSCRGLISLIEADIP